VNHEPDVAREGRDLLVDPDEIPVCVPKKARQAGHADPGPERLTQRRVAGRPSPPTPRSPSAWLHNIVEMCDGAGCERDATLLHLQLATASPVLGCRCRSHESWPFVLLSEGHSATPTAWLIVFGSFNAASIACAALAREIP
jgi:hypothetical protein